MKTIQKYTQRSIPLFVGLLSFNTLSACSHIKQELGMGCLDNWARSVRRNPKTTIAIGTTVGIIIGSGTGAGIMSSLQNGSAPSTAGNPITLAPSISSSTATPEAWTGSSTTLSTTTIEAILSSIPTLPPAEQQKLNEELFKAIDDGSHTNVANLIHRHPTLDVNARNKDNNTPLIQAIWKDNLDIITLLLDNGADVNERDKDNNTPLTNAISNQDANMAKLLLDNGADVNARDKHHNTPLMTAILKGDINISKLLLDNKSDVNARADFNNTPLILAVIKHKKDFVKLLLDHGADVGLKNDNGKTALDIAKLLPISKEVEEMIALLEPTKDPNPDNA